MVSEMTSIGTTLDPEVDPSPEMDNDDIATLAIWSLDEDVAIALSGSGRISISLCRWDLLRRD